MFIRGTGRTLEFSFPRYLKSEIFFSFAAALETANDTDKIALAPSLDLLGVLSRLIIFESINDCSKIDISFSSLKIISLTFLTASKTDLPI